MKQTKPENPQSLSRGIKKILKRSRYNFTGRQEFRFLQCPDGTGKVYEAILLTLMLITCRIFFGECRVDAWLNAVLFLKRIETLYQTNANYNGPESPPHLRFAHGYFSGVLDGRLCYHDPIWAGTDRAQTFYIVDHVFPQLDLAFARQRVPRFAKGIEMQKCGIFGQQSDRISLLCYSMKAPQLGVSKMKFTDAIPVEDAVKDEFEAFRKVVDDSDPNQVNMPSIGEFFVRNTAWSNRSGIKDFVNDIVGRVLQGNQGKDAHCLA